MFHTPDKIQHDRHTTISNVCTSSTPYNNARKRHYSISLSGIDTASSSSDKVRDKLQSQAQEKPTKKNKRKTKKRQVILSEDIDNEWETVSSDNESSAVSPRSTLKKCDGDSVRYNLFDDPCTPEKVRDAPMTYESPCESPILGSSRRLRLVSRKDDITQRDQLLPVTNIPSAKVPDSPEDTDELICHYERNVRTYLPALKREKSPKRETKNWMFGVYFPTASSDLLWDEFVEKNRDDPAIARYLASPTARKPIKLTDSMRGLPDVLRKPPINPVPPGMQCIQGYWDETMQKWISYKKRCSPERKNEGAINERKTKTREMNKRKRKRKTVTLQSVRETVYDQSDDTDYEFETGGQGGKRMSLGEFRCKQRMHKNVLDSQ